MTYACPAWKFTPDNHQMRLQLLQNKILRTNGNFLRRTPVRDLHMAFKLPYMYDYITKLCRQEEQVIQKMEMQMFATLGKAKPNTEK
jgi:hypothetical protein